MEKYLVKIEDNNPTIAFIMHNNENTEKYLKKILYVLDKNCIKHIISNSFNGQKEKITHVSFNLYLNSFAELNEIKDILFQYQFLFIKFSIDTQVVNPLIGFLSIYTHILKTKDECELCIDASGCSLCLSENINIIKRDNKFLVYNSLYSLNGELANRTEEEEISIDDVFSALMVYPKWKLIKIY